MFKIINYQIAALYKINYYKIIMLKEIILIYYNKFQANNLYLMEIIDNLINY